MRRSALVPIALGLIVMIGEHMPGADAASEAPLDVNVSPDSALFRVDQMVPGDTRFAGLTISNAGSKAFDYTIAVSATNADGKGLARRLEGSVRGVAEVCDAATFAQSSERIAGSSTLAVLSTRTPRTLMPGEHEVACVRIHLPIGTGNQIQGAICSATFHIQTTPAKEAYRGS